MAGHVDTAAEMVGDHNGAGRGGPQHQHQASKKKRVPRHNLPSLTERNLPPPPYNQRVMLRFHTAGESHGQGLVALVQGLPAGVDADLELLNNELRRRQGGYGRGGRMKIETDTAEILAGVRRGKTTGAPVALLIRNKDWENWKDILPVEARPGEEDQRKLTAPRPGHADLAGCLKYDLHDARYVLERASAR